MFSQKIISTKIVVMRSPRLNEGNYLIISVRHGHGGIGICESNFINSFFRFYAELMVML